MLAHYTDMFIMSYTRGNGGVGVQLNMYSMYNTV